MQTDNTINAAVSQDNFMVIRGRILKCGNPLEIEDEIKRIKDEMNLPIRVVRACVKEIEDERKGRKAHNARKVITESDKPVIDAKPGELNRIICQAEQALIGADVPIFQRSGVMVRPAVLPVAIKIDDSTIPPGSLVIEPVNKFWLSEKMNEVAVWRKWNERKKDMAPTDCPQKYAEHYLAKKGEWNVRVLMGIIESPTLRRDGSLLTTPGYDPVSGLYLNYTGELVTVPEMPTRQDAIDALAVLKEPFEEFPFAGDSDRSVILSGLLTAVVRRSVNTAPYHATDAPVPGSGKGLLVDVCAIVATGRVATTTTLGADEAETEKRLGALLIRGVPVISLDNAARHVEGDFLCSLATQETVDIRVLGQSATATVPACTSTIFVTGNNLIFKGDMTRRILICRIDPRCERPDARNFTRDLRTYVTENRHRLLSAALTVLRAYHCAGRPSHGKAPYGSFEQWDSLVRGTLLWLDQPDPLSSRENIVANDPDATRLKCLLTAWFEVFKEDRVTTAKIIQAATPSGSGTFSHAGGEDLREALLEIAGKGDTINARSLGRYLSRNRERVVNGYRLEVAGEYKDKPVWRISETDRKEEKDSAETNGGRIVWTPSGIPLKIAK